MSWLKKLWNPLGKAEPASVPPAPAAPGQTPSEGEGAEAPKGLMGTFYRKWKDPAFLKQIRALSAHMMKEGVDLKDMKAVKAWLDKNKDAIEAGRFNEAPVGPVKGETYVKKTPDIGRNDPCPCGSGKKYKKCCETKAAS
jgi:hypothetical protein